MRARPAQAGRAVARLAQAGRTVARLTTAALLLVTGAAWAGGLPAPTRRATKLPPSVVRAAQNPGLRAITSPRSFDFVRDIGLVEGERKDSLWLMIADSTLAAGDSLTLISDEPNPDPDTYVAIIGAAVKEPLSNIPRELYGKAVPEPGDRFYRLATPAGALDCCIFGYAVRAPRSSFRRASGRAEADLDHDGTMEIFQSCGSGDFLNPTVWSGSALTGTRRWTRAYHADYAVETNCPGSLDSLRTK
ncbi:MAG TPA: hypothetical protein VE326_06775 [Candidatus Binatia bacterium]|nr:hypothetical protein [Candidatus Binatia bacterium]